MAEVATEVPPSCRPGWNPDYELIASHIPTLILPSYATVSAPLTFFLLHPP
jgi:ABC-type Fe3+-hydroxamate transport system substrate-binding protein